jgi:hypothetical protein
MQSSVRNAYSDFTAISTDVTQGTSYVNGKFKYRRWLWCNAWIDWNQDGDFFDLGEAYDFGTRNNHVPAVGPYITIPTTALQGNTRMRISAKYNIQIHVIRSFDGEEDYTINIIASRTITTGTITNFYCAWASKHTFYNNRNLQYRQYFYRPVIWWNRWF